MRRRLISLTSAQDPLKVFPAVLGSSADSVDALIDIMAMNCSAKEVIMAVEEVVENLDARFQCDDDEISQVSTSQQILRVIRTYTATIPRLPQWKTFPKKTVESRISEVESIIARVGAEATAEEGRSIIRAVSQLVAMLGQDADADTKALLRNAVETALTSFPNDPQAGLAQQAFASHFRRLIFRQPQPSEDAREDVIIAAWGALRSIGYTESFYAGTPSLVALILLAHSPSYAFSASSLSAIFPILLSSLQSSVALDEILATLIKYLTPLRSANPPSELEIDLIVPLVHLLPPLASNHPDPDIRHYTFRILSTVLGLSPAPIRFRLLEDLLSDEDTPPQMRIAAVGLLKEAVLEALSQGAKNVFASSQLLNTFGPIVLRPNPPNFLTSVTAEEFLDGPEPLRLVECLGFYYVLLQRDEENKTGVRNYTSTTDVQESLLDPLEVGLKKWKNELASSADGGQSHNDALQLDILSMWVERVQGAL
ncbi:hypothetical protein BC628DRAFT_193803 [Trametes gibbosa]|nr:hypothetical protein BC628DRAFT_193803 [Trametes gibbosa]